MDTIIVEICIAVTGRVVDFVLPAHVPVRALLNDIIALVEQAFAHIAVDDEQPLLYDRDRAALIPPEMTLAQAGIHDSSQLLLL